MLVFRAGDSYIKWHSVANTGLFRHFRSIPLKDFIVMIMTLFHSVPWLMRMVVSRGADDVDFRRFHNWVHVKNPLILRLVCDQSLPKVRSK